MIFYFTGTGNSLYSAKYLDAEILSIPRIMKRDNLIFESERIGIVCPVYGHEMPAMVKEFLRKATFHTDYLYVVLTYGARHANAVELADQALRDSGKKASYITTLMMVDNFLPVFDMNEEIRLDKKVEQNLFAIKSDIQAKKQSLQEVTPQDRAIHEQYLNMVSNAPETVWAKFHITEECVGCGICTKVCPAGCLELKDQKAVYDNKQCQACFACIHACTKLAIGMNIPEKNPHARYRNEHITLSEIVMANNQTKN